MASEYKKEKEAFVSDLTGTYLLEISFLVSLYAFAYLFQRLLLQSIGDHHPIVITFALEYLTLCLPVLLACTWLNGYIYYICSVLFSAALILGLRNGGNGKMRMIERERAALLRREKLVEIGFFRTETLLLTCICILAVDFPIFPRRFAKVENYGTGLMDIGVGCFVFSNGVVVGARSKTKPTAAIPLGLLGLGRWVSMQGLDYHEHVSEYGVHWNFFFTLMALVLLSSVVDKFLPSAYPGAIGSTILLLYQGFLSQYPGLESWLLSNPSNRTELDLFTQNKEGIASTVGHLGLFYLAARLGRLYKNRSEMKLREWRVYLGMLWGVSLVLWVVFLGLVHVVGIDVSRRLCNASYAMWVITLAHMMITICLSIQLLPTRLCAVSSSLIVEAMNLNQLPIFLLANVATGAINMSMDTIHMEDPEAFLVLNGYLFFITFISVILYQNNMKLKFW